MINILLATVALSLFNTNTASTQYTLSCPQSAFAALKRMPELKYSCDGLPNEWDEKILQHPPRVAAIKELMAKLASFSNANWWQADTEDLNVCDFTRKPRTLTSAQRRDFLRGDYVFWLFGDERIRLVLIPDPCYQTEYGGANAFLLHRKGDRVYVSEAIDGYFSRADNSVNIAFAKLNTEDIIEISTGSGGLNPTLTNYYFTIDPATNKAVPKNLFVGEHSPTNQITSAMLFEDWHGASTPLVIIRRNTLALSFRIYEDDEDGKIEDNGRKLKQTILRWNGKMYR